MLPSSGDEPFMAGTMPPGLAAPPSGLHPPFLNPDAPDSFGAFSKEGAPGSIDSPPGLRSSYSLSSGFLPAPNASGALHNNFSRSLSENPRSHFLPSDHQRAPPISLQPNLEAPMSALSVNQPKPSNIEVTNELSIFVGDLSSTLQEEDLVNQFLDPPGWPSGHPCLVAYLQSHNHMTPHELPQANVGPAPFTGIKGAKVCTDSSSGLVR